MARTKHIPIAVLTAVLASDIGLQAKIQHCQVLDGIVVGIQTADDTEASTLMDLLAELIDP